MIRVLESNLKKRRNRLPIFARRQCRNAAPIVLPFFAQRDALRGAMVGHSDQHTATFGVGKGNEGFNAGLVKSRLEFLRLGFSSLYPLLKGVLSRGHA